MTKAKVLAVSKSGSHTFNKFTCEQITLLKGLGVEGDAHMGAKVKHRYLVKKDPDQPNLRQVHLIHSELFTALATKGFEGIQPGQMGENITSIGVDLLALPRNTILTIGKEVQIQITGLRDPCDQVNSIKDGLFNALIFKDADNKIIRLSGVMAIVLEGGVIHKGDRIRVVLPEKPFLTLEPV